MTDARYERNSKTIAERSGSTRAPKMIAGLVGIMVLVEVSMNGLGTAAWAAGGIGGSIEISAGPGGAGGTGLNGAAGASRFRQFGGGGGGGAGGGAGGATGPRGTYGGAGGTFSSKDGGEGGPGGDGQGHYGGGGGGGGYSNNGGMAALTNRAPLAGGRGGAGGSGLANYPNYKITSGGGGGAGGYGAVVGNAGTNSNFSVIKGGDGGDGGTQGRSFFLPGGGDGGIGIAFTAPGATFNNAGSVTGGNGGAGGKGSYSSSTGPAGSGGVGISGAGLTINNAGTITGGMAGIGGKQTYVIHFTGSKGSYNVSTRPAGAGGVGIAGSGLIINNAGTITGGMAGIGGQQDYAIHLTGGLSSIGGGGAINGGIHVTGEGSFVPGLPGSPVGTPLAINGPITFAPGTQYGVRVTPASTDSVVATGGATITGAKVAVLAGGGSTYRSGRARPVGNAGYDTYTAGTTRTILTASALSGTFTGVTSNLAFLKPTLSYDPTHVFLTIAVRPNTAFSAKSHIARTVVTTNPVTGVLTLVPNYRPAAVTIDQFAIAASLTNAGVADGGTGKVLKAVNQLTVPQADADFNELTGEGLTAAQNVAYRAGALFDSAIFDQTTFYGAGGTGNNITLAAPTPSGMLAYAPIHELADLPSATHQPVTPAAPDRGLRAWASGFGGVEDIHGDAVIGSATQDSTIYGGVLGVDDQLTPNYLVGVALGGSDGTFSVADRATSGSTTGGHIAFYDLATFGSFYGASSNAFSYYTNKTTRLVSGFGGLGGETEQGTFDSHEFRSRLEFGRHFDLYGGTMTPFVALDLAELRSNGFGETAQSGPGLLALNVSGQSSASAPSSVGARFQRVTALGNGLVLTPTLELAYVHEFAPQRTQFGTLASLPGSTFLVDGASPGSNAATVKAGGEIALGGSSSLFANFDGEFSDTSQYYGGKGGFKFVW